MESVLFGNDKEIFHMFHMELIDLVFLPTHIHALCLLVRPPTCPVWLIERLINMAIGCANFHMVTEGELGMKLA